jgi:hypothetical protein
MANIKVRDLTSIAGTDLFNDSESFMQDLSDDELALQGGATPIASYWFVGGGIAVAGLLMAAVIAYNN